MDRAGSKRKARREEWPGHDDAVRWARRTLREFDAVLRAEERGEPLPGGFCVRRMRSGGVLIEIRTDGGVLQDWSQGE